MKHIAKFLNNEPNSLKKYRETTENATYSGYVDKDIETGEEKPLKKALATEQGYICCYCNNRIEIDKMTVEHYKPQSLYPKDDLNYMNLLGSCKNEERDCSEIRGNEILTHINPLKKGIEGLFGYRKKLSKEGHAIGYEIYALSGKYQSELEKEIVILGLNEEKLCLARKIAIEREQNKLNKIGKGLRTKSEISDRMNQFLNPKPKILAPFCMAILWYLQEKLAKRN
ncbi:MAG: retron system putative HNH endonuclease [Bacteroidia bacterium]